jgi:hypothetical protein
MLFGDSDDGCCTDGVKIRVVGGIVSVVDEGLNEQIEE